MTMMSGDEKHTPSATSTLDVIWTLYDRVLDVDPGNPNLDSRDRFLLSKGHGPIAYYAILAAKGFFPSEWLPGFGTFDSRLGQHPDSTLIPGVEIGSGSLGHGLPIAVGVAVALDAKSTLRKYSPTSPRVICLVGDAELDEGSNHEAIQYAGRVGLSRLTVIVVDNQSATHGWPGGVELRFETEGWTTRRADGRNHDAIESALADAGGESPHCVVVRVEVKG